MPVRHAPHVVSPASVREHTSRDEKKESHLPPFLPSQIRAKRVLAVRHAPTASPGLCVGNGEVPCAISEQDAAGRILASVAEYSFTCVWTSPVERCRGPAALIAQSLRVPLRIDDRLNEISLGEWQLRSWASIEASEPERYQSWLESWLTRAPPGGELPGELLRRVGEWWNDLPTGAHLLVAHAGVIRALRVLVDGKSWIKAMTVTVPHLQGESFEQLID